MAETLTSERMMPQNTASKTGMQNRSPVLQDQVAPTRAFRGASWLIPTTLLTGFIATAALWWRFGEMVFLNTMVTAFMACF
jgi:hypothetical protein